ncbi:MAG: hypothetical protein FJ309_16135 [Planctomycetes bacterium]|nr:hypothetical protein [Planctomycetota bacterium]
MPRWVLLEHVAAPDDPVGRHYDLLLEAGESCRTWRLAEIPRAGGPAVPAVAIAPHRLAWLDHVAGEVSGGRGFARRVDGGTADVAEPADGRLGEAARIVALLGGVILSGVLVVERDDSGWSAALRPDG